MGNTVSAVLTFKPKWWQFWKRTEYRTVTYKCIGTAAGK